MLIERKEIISVNGLYISQLYKDWFAAEAVVLRDGTFFRIRCPYNTQTKAMSAIDFLNGKKTEMPKMDYNPIIHVCDRNGHVR